MTAAVSGQPIVAVLDAFTPVDVSVYESLPPQARERHHLDLTRRLAIAAELGRPGAGAQVIQAAHDTTDPNPVHTIDALIEFGRRPEQLTADQLVQVRQSQIRDEILHFDRIMDLDALRDGRDLKRRRDQAWDTGPHAALERLLTLTYERRVLRGDEQPEWLHIGASESGVIRNHPGGAVLIQNSSPRLVAVAAGPQATECLHRLSAYCRTHPLGVAIGLLDYELALNGESSCRLIAATTAAWFDANTVKIWACGDGHAFTATREGHRQRAEYLTPLAGAAIGGPIPVFARAEFHAAPDSRIVITLGKHALDVVMLSAELSRANNKQRIYLHENLTRLFGKGRFAKLNPDSSRSRQPAELSVIDDYLAAQLGAHHGPCTISLEIGHVHADRELGPIQQHGIDLGVAVINAIRGVNLHRAEGHQIATEIVPMIDDDHVVNRLSYRRFQQSLCERQVPADEIVLESSPLILDIACDLISTAIRGDGAGYNLQRHGRNLYLECGPHRIELVENVDDEMRVGCVVFDTAVTVYRAARHDMQAVFAQRTGYPGNLHQDMLASYDNQPNPQGRQLIRRDLDRLWKRPLSELASARDTPYLDAYRAAARQRSTTNHKVVILNVLEDYYEPLELKVRQFARLLGVDVSLDCLLFSPYGSGLRSLHA